eukprot:scaffold1215_cov19-Prasinocladus_malaysianus.AAC.1
MTYPSTRVQNPKLAARRAGSRFQTHLDDYEYKPMTQRASRTYVPPLSLVFVWQRGSEYGTSTTELRPSPQQTKP